MPWLTNRHGPAPASMKSMFPVSAWKFCRSSDSSRERAALMSFRYPNPIMRRRRPRTRARRSEACWTPFGLAAAMAPASHHRRASRALLPRAHGPNQSSSDCEPAAPYNSIGGSHRLRAPRRPPLSESIVTRIVELHQCLPTVEEPGPSTISGWPQPVLGPVLAWPRALRCRTGHSPLVGDGHG